MPKIIEEKQTGKYRLLILDGEILLQHQGQDVTIGKKRFIAFSAHGLKNAVAIIIPKGCDISFKGLSINAEKP